MTPKIESDLAIIKWMVGSNIALTLLLIALVLNLFALPL